jgi:hypothetical protein
MQKQLDQLSLAGELVEGVTNFLSGVDARVD